MKRDFFTIGHSTRSVDDFIALLNIHGIGLVVDVRAFPRSRTNPQYNSQEFSTALSRFGIGYQHMPALGGRRGRSRDLPEEPNSFWENRSFQNYADYARTEGFKSGLRELQQRGQAVRSVIMCSEGVWWRCHRRIIADYLIAAGETVFHILGAGRLDQARLTQGARLGQNGEVLYGPIHEKASRFHGSAACVRQGCRSTL